MSENREPQGGDWPQSLRIPDDEFRQSYAVAELAAVLCAQQQGKFEKQWEAEDHKFKADMAKATHIPNEQERLSKQRLEQLAKRFNLVPENFVGQAWSLINKAREHVLRPLTSMEYLVANNGDKEALARVIGRNDALRRIPFQKLCNVETTEDDTEINGISWKVYRSERGFDDLFWRYWSDIGEKWKTGNQEVGSMKGVDTKGVPRRIDFYSESKRNKIAALWRKWPEKIAARWAKQGERLLDSWKKGGVAPPDFLAVAEFRKAHDNRAANLRRPEAQSAHAG